MKPTQTIHSLRARLTLGLTLVLTVLLLVYGLLAYTELQTDLKETAEAKLRAQVGPTLTRYSNPGATPGKDLQQVAATLANDLAAQGLAVQVYDQDGRPLVNNRPESDKTGLSMQLTASLDGMEQFRIEPGAGGRELVYLTPFYSSDGMVQGVVEAHTSMVHVDVSLSRARLLLLTGGLAVLFAALGLSYLVIRIALRPLTNMAVTARTIASSGLTGRAAVPPGGDEVTDLVMAFNSMLDQLESAFAAQRRATDQVRQFAADASHELRSHLTVVTGYLDVLKRGAASEPQEQARVLTAARTELERLNRVVDDLLTLARLGAGSPLHRQGLEVSGLMYDAAQRARLLAPGRQINVQCPVLPVLPADPDRMRQVLNNLVDNALRHTPPGADITLGAELRDESLCLWVHDTGPGILAQHLPHVFERFWRADASRSRGKGSGLGLAIVSAIVEAHGGTISVDSSPDRGTTFTACLPLCIRANLHAPDEVLS